MVEGAEQAKFRPEIETYRTALETALREGNGKITSTKARILIELRTTLGISEDEHTKIMNELLAEYENPSTNTYRSAIEQAMSDGRITPDEEAILALLRESMNISMDEHNQIVAEVQAKNISEKQPQEVVSQEAIEENIKAPSESDPAYWIQKGELTWATSDGRVNEALKTLNYFDKAIELDPLNFLAWANKGLVLKSLDRMDDALLCYNRALTINPNYITVWYNKGVLLGSIGNFDEAIKAFDKVLELNPKHEFAMRDREILLSIIRKQKKEQAQKETQTQPQQQTPQ
ncbi:tetratricopeptide repeat protein [[Eubacterium] cellulosolvens]